MSFQASDLKGRNFLELLDNNLNPFELPTIKGSPWLQYFSHSNSLCAKAIRAIINHVLIGEYQLRFFSRCYKLRSLELDKRKNLVLELTQENSIENSVQDCLPYILIPNGPCELLLAYPK